MMNEDDLASPCPLRGALIEERSSPGNLSPFIRRKTEPPSLISTAVSRSNCWTSSRALVPPTLSWGRSSDRTWVRHDDGLSIRSMGLRA